MTAAPLVRPKDRTDPGTRARVAACLRVALLAEGGEHASERPRLLEQDLRWVRGMGLQSLFAGNVPCLGVDAEVHGRLATVHRQNTLESLRLAAVTAELLADLRDRGVRALTYKGVALAVASTGDLSSRPPGDIDLLVDHRDAEVAHAVLTQRGWRSKEGDLPHAGDRGWSLTRRITCENTYRSAGPSVDLHWRLDPNPRNYRRSFDDLWDERSHVHAGGISLPTLGPTDALLLTAVHGTRERWFRWKHVVDWVRQARADADPDATERRARQVGAARAVRVAAAVGRVALGEPCEDRWAAELASQAWSHAAVGGHPARVRDPVGRRAGQVWRWRICDSLPARAANVTAPLVRQGWKLYR